MKHLIWGSLSMVLSALTLLNALIGKGELVALSLLCGSLYAAYGIYRLNQYRETRKKIDTENGNRASPVNSIVIFQKDVLMINQPLNSSDHGKILIFTLLLAPSIVFGFGAIPALFLGFGIFMMKKNEDFSHVETAVKNSRVYCSLWLAGWVVALLYFGSTYGDPYYYDGSYWFKRQEFISSTIGSAIAFTYLVLIKVLFLVPLQSHSEWVEKNGIFSSKPKSLNTENNTSKVDIVKGDMLKQYSVADELLKWVKLKDGGHISEKEFNEAREKLLRRN